ncbi:MAG: ABC transporter ATP-binding protein [Candidatus Hadarchaeum sp.]|uniref:ABC transporter ATP-binding protein n=1 Tax=Candidatus Hadarchaeum sp. TaxID=2883567 RepID=UPI003D10F56B
MSTEAILKIDRVSKKYEECEALREVSFSVNKGELVVILGPSGSGKSTLLMCIAGFVKPDSGDIILDGKRINDVPPYRRNVGVVFQSMALFPNMNVFDNIAYPLKIRKLPKDEIKKKVERMLEIVGLAGLGSRRITQLSGGQQQRVAIARTLVFEPSILLLDEPLGALDRKLREEMQGEIKKIHDRVGATTLLVTHDQEEAMTMGDRILVINGGRIEQMGTPEEIYNDPKTLFVSEFIGTTNIFNGVAVKKDGRTVFKSVEGVILPLAKEAKGEGHVSIKAEHIKLFGNRPKDDIFALEAIVAQNFFSGNFIKYELDLEGTIIKAIDRDPKQVFKQGQKVYMKVTPENVRWFPK